MAEKTQKVEFYLKDNLFFVCMISDLNLFLKKNPNNSNPSTLHTPCDPAHGHSQFRIGG